MRRLIILFLSVALLAAGCSHSRTIRRSSNLVSFLYPNGMAEDPAPNLPFRLQLPLRLGIAFVPSPGTERRWAMQSVVPAVAEKQLLEIVRREFQGKDWVKEIVIIPSTYLMPGGGFDNLDQVSQMFGTNVIALVSVDQLQSSDPSPVSFLYLSIIGAYTLPLDHNDTRTLIDLAVFHVPSRRFLLRAPGQSHIRGHATAVGVSEALRAKQQKGLELAMKDLTARLQPEIDGFKAAVASGERDDLDIVTRSGQSVRHGGNFGMAGALIALMIAFAAIVTRR